MPGTVLGERYRLLRPLGSGGMAHVWAALDERLGREVAVKVPSDAFAADPAFLRRFAREGRLAARLAHPNLVRVFDVGACGGRPYLVMELVPGGSLAARTAGGTGPPVDPARIAAGLLAALAHIHAAGVVHRDLTPGNVLLDPDGRPRLTDFGIARPDDATGLTLAGQVLGTPRYMAPEVRRGEPATAVGDLYSLGVVLGELAPGPALAPLVARLTAADPADRPASAATALAALPAGAAPPDPAGDATVALVRAPRRRRARRAALGGAILAVPLVTLALVALGGGGDGDRTDAAAPPPAATVTTIATIPAAPAPPATTAPAADPPSATTPPAPVAADGDPDEACARLRERRDELERGRDRERRVADAGRGKARASKRHRKEIRQIDRRIRECRRERR